MAKILVVDDSMELLDVFSTILQWSGYEVRAVSSKDTVKNSLSVFIPDVILLDVRLNGYDGRELCKDIKEKHIKNIPIILMSASPELLIDYEECNADAILEKPFEIHTVTETVNKVLNKYQSALPMPIILAISFFP